MPSWTKGVTGRKSEVGFQWNPYGVEPGLAQGEPIDQLNNGCTGPTDTNCMPPEHEFAEPIDTVNDPNNVAGHRDFLNDVGLLMAIDNSNTAGVNAGTGAATGTPQNVVTGIEFSLPLATLGHPLGPIKIAAFINSGSHNFVSNQFAGTGVVRGNLGGSLSSINLATIAGDQFVTVPYVGLAGDYNGNGTVDAVDYTVWRDGFDAFYELDDYDVWREHYGDMLEVGAGSIAVPEPMGIVLVATAMVMCALARRAKPQAV